MINERWGLSFRRSILAYKRREAVILAGGLGTRLRCMCPDIPKVMAPIAGRPFLEMVLHALANKGFERIILALGFMAPTIMTYFGDQFMGMDLIYEVETTPLGTGGATRQALTRCKTDAVFVFNGDTYLDLEVDAIETHWKMHQNPIIVARKEQETSRYGCMETKGNRVIRFLEKSVSGPGIINTGCYLLPTDSLLQFQPGQPFSLETAFFARAVETQPIDFFMTAGYFIDIGIANDYIRAQLELTERIP